MPTFCRHGRFVERCPICSRDLPTGSSRPAGRGKPASAGTARRAGATAERRTRSGGAEGVRVRRLERAGDDGFRSPLVPGLRASEDAERLAEEIAFASARLDVLEADPPGLYATARDAGDLEQGSWICFLTVYLSPLQDDQDGDDPFRAIREVLVPWTPGDGAEGLPDLDGVELGPRTSHDPERGNATLVAYRQWAGRAGSQTAALRGDADWTAARRFERVFERLALPGLGRAGRYDLLVTLGRLGLYEMRPDALHLVGDDATTLAAKRVFGIGDAFNLERRARSLAEACGTPLEALDLALANWGTGERATLGCPADLFDDDVAERARDALRL